MVMTIQVTGVWLKRRLLILFWNLHQIFKDLYFSFEWWFFVHCLYHRIFRLWSGFLGNPDWPTQPYNPDERGNTLLYTLLKWTFILNSFGSASF
jgi:hypothetical protein